MHALNNIIIYEDNSILVINKPHGLPSQPDQKGSNNLWDMAESYCSHPLHIVNRLDRPASGIVMLAKSAKDYNIIKDNWNAPSTIKEYLVIVEGNWDEKSKTLTHTIKKGRGNKAIQHPKGRLAKLVVEAYPIFDNYSLCRVFLNTGRFHQIRFQLSAMGHPVKGDVKYGARRGNQDRSIYLHAYRLELGGKSFIAPLSNKDSLWKIANEYYNKTLT